jgi:transcriptional regulator with XRE-family HTH domain
MKPKRPIPKKISTITKAARLRTGETKEQFAARLGVGRTDVHKYENSTTSPTIAAFMQILRVLAELRYNTWRLPADFFTDWDELAPEKPAKRNGTITEHEQQ